MGGLAYLRVNDAGGQVVPWRAASPRQILQARFSRLGVAVQPLPHDILATIEYFCDPLHRIATRREQHHVRSLRHAPHRPPPQTLQSPTLRTRQHPNLHLHPALALHATSRGAYPIPASVPKLSSSA